MEEFMNCPHAAFGACSLCYSSLKSQLVESEAQIKEWKAESARYQAELARLGVRFGEAKAEINKWVDNQ